MCIVHDCDLGEVMYTLSLECKQCSHNFMAAADNAVAIENSLRLHSRGGPAASAEAV